MLIDTRHARLPLCHGQMLRLRRARHTRLTCVRGEAWVTLDGDLRDIVLSPGDTFVVDSDAAVVVYPLRAAQAVELAVDTTTRRGARRGLLGAWRDWIAPARPAVAAVA
ncbi:DUF2917 domain-containing protein [Piscinibacter sp.]|uniref:DUF2917 domain-containing protein n=1 Tax=Piscinibacter sp. TaxID=1903157 RepID=UPI003559B0FD